MLYNVQVGSSLDSSITCLSVSSDGSKVAVGTSDGSLILYDISAPAPSPLPDPPGEPPVLAVLLSPGTPGSALPPALAVSLSSDGTMVAAGSGQLVLIWQRYSNSWLPRYELSGHTGIVRSVAVSLDGRHVHSGACDATVRAWDLTVGLQAGPAMPLGGTSTCATVVARSGDGRSVAAAGDGDGLIRFWAVWMTAGRR